MKVKKELWVVAVLAFLFAAFYVAIVQVDIQRSTYALLICLFCFSNYQLQDLRDSITVVDKDDELEELNKILEKEND